MLAASPVFAAPPGAANTPKIDHVRGIILGTTSTSLDVGTPTRTDIHLEMALEPYVVIAEPSDATAIVPNAFVSVLSSGKNDRVRCVIVVPDTAHVFSAGREPWDARGEKSMLTSGRVTTIGSGGRASFAIRFAGTVRRFMLPKGAPVIALRPGTRAALLSPHNVFVFAAPPTTELTDFVRSIIVADGPLALPF